MSDVEVLSEQIISQQGCCLTIKRWLRGKHPSLGVIIYGFTGWETVQEKTVVRPSAVVEVKEIA